MYVDRSGFTYDRSGDQAHTRAPFLLLASSAREHYADDTEMLYGAIRKVALRQCGNFMMGAARIAGFTFSVSGGFGNDGLPLNFDSFGVRRPGARDHLGRETGYAYLTYEESAPIRAHFKPLPAELAAQYWHTERADPSLIAAMVAFLEAPE